MSFFDLDPIGWMFVGLLAGGLSSLLVGGRAARGCLPNILVGILGGIGPHPEDVMHMRRTADRLFGDQYRWSVLAAGRHQMPILTMAATMGANVRVGLEDSLWLGPGQLAKSNADQVRKIRTLIESLGGEIATPAEARAMLGLKGGDRVAF